VGSAALVANLFEFVFVGHNSSQLSAISSQLSIRFWLTAES